MNRSLAVAALMLAAWSMNTATAAGAPLHSDPATDDNLRIYILVGGSAATVALDGEGPSSVPGQWVAFARLAPGAHKWTVTLPDGISASADFTLSAGRHD